MKTEIIIFEILESQLISVQQPQGEISFLATYLLFPCASLIILILYFNSNNNLNKLIQTRPPLSLPLPTNFLLLSKPDKIANSGRPLIMINLQIKRKKYYSEVAERLGNLMRSQLMGQKKFINSPSKLKHFVSSYTEVEPSPLITEMQEVSSSQEKKEILKPADIMSQKDKIIREMKRMHNKKLFQNEEKRRSQAEKLRKTIKWKRDRSLRLKQKILDECYDKKRNEAEFVKNILSQSHEKMNREKIKDELQKAFSFLQRKIKNSNGLSPAKGKQ